MNYSVSPRLREIEREIDLAYKSNPLVALPFGDACWNILAFFEDFAAKDIFKGFKPTIHESAELSDSIMVNIQYPIRWLFNSCTPGTTRSFTYTDSNYEAAFHLFELALQYNQFDSAYTYASQGQIKLRLSGSHIFVEDNFLDSRYEAYDRLIPVYPTSPDTKGPNIISLVNQHLVVTSDNFHYQWGERFITQCMKFLQPIIEEMFTLPDYWEFPRYSILEFRRMTSILTTLGYIHYTARIIAAKQKCAGLAINNAVLLLGENQLQRLISRYSGISHLKVAKFVEDFTYGSRGIQKPDPALQPIIPLGSGIMAIMPNLIINNSLERNWITLMNRIEEDRPHYLRLTNEKENVMRDSILSKLRSNQIREFHGYIPGTKGLPDIDLAIICPKDKVVILAELKWFVMPSEVREVIEKSKEIQKGVSQALRLAEVYETSPQVLFEAFDVDNSYSFLFIVISDNVIGQEYVQHPKVPVVQADHFCRKAMQFNDLRKLADWLSNRRYLPQEGVHYEVVPVKATIGPWSLDWYGIKPLISSSFDP